MSAQRWYRRLLRILPLDFRSDYGREMEQVFRDQHRDAAAHGRMRLFRLWMANAGAVLAIGPREHAAQFAQDVRYALRGMRAHPGFVIVALVMIALGTGANAAMFSVIDAVMLRSPFQDPERLAVIRVVYPGAGPTNAVSLAQYRSLLDSAPALVAIGALGVGGRPTVTGLGEPKRLNVECFTAGMFPVLGVSPLAGRTFTADEDRPGGPGAVVLSTTSAAESAAVRMWGARCRSMVFRPRLSGSCRAASSVRSRGMAPMPGCRSDRVSSSTAPPDA